MRKPTQLCGKAAPKSLLKYSNNQSPEPLQAASSCRALSHGVSARAAVVNTNAAAARSPPRGRGRARGRGRSRTVCQTPPQAAFGEGPFHRHWWSSATAGLSSRRTTRRSPAVSSIRLFERLAGVQVLIWQCLAERRDGGDGVSTRAAVQPPCTTVRRGMQLARRRRWSGIDRKTDRKQVRK